MDGQNRKTLGERLAARLSDRSRRRPRMALDPSFYARFGLEDPWGAPELGAETVDSGDGMVFLSGAPFYAMMRRLANARRRRERRLERFHARRAGHTMRAASRRWAGEAVVGAVPSHIARPGPDGFILPPPIGAAEAPAEAQADAALVPGAPYQAMRPVSSPWYTTPFVPARVNRGGAAPVAPVERARPLARVGERLQESAARNGEPARVVADLPARVRRAASSVLVDVLPPEMLVVELVRVLRRVGAPASVIREIVELSPAPSSMITAARRAPLAAGPVRPAGLRTVLSKSPAMALAASADADRAAVGTLAEAERAEVSTGVERPRRRVASALSARVAGRSVGSPSVALSASPVARVSAGRPAALRVPQAGAEAAGRSEAASADVASPVVRRDANDAGVTRRVGTRFFPRPFRGQREDVVDEAGAALSVAVAGTAHAISRIQAPAPVTRPLRRLDGAAWAHVRSVEAEQTVEGSLAPVAVPARRVTPAVGAAPRLSAARPVRGTPDRFVPARVAVASGALSSGGQEAGPRPLAPVRRSPAVRGRPGRPARALLDSASTSLVLPPAGASPVQQAFARLGMEDPALPPVLGSLVPHATPRLDRPVRTARTLAADAFAPVQPIGTSGDAETAPVAGVPTPRAVSAPLAARPAVASRVVFVRAPAARSDASAAHAAGATAAPDSPVFRALARGQSPSRTAAERLISPRVSTSEVVRAAPPSSVESAPSPVASGPMSWAPQARFAVPARRAGRRVPSPSIAVQPADIAGSTPVREPSGRFVSARSTRTSQRGVARLSAVGPGRVEVVYVTPTTPDLNAAVASDVGVASAPASAPRRTLPVRSLAWATARTDVARATAYRSAFIDGGLPPAERAAISGVEAPARRNRTTRTDADVLVAAPIATTAGDASSAAAAASSGAAASGGAAASSRAAGVSRAAARAFPSAEPTARPGVAARAPVTREPVTRGAAPARRANVLGPDRFVAPGPAAPFGFDPADVDPATGTPVTADTPVARTISSRPPLDRRLHDLATGGGSGGAADAPTWNARADGAPRVRSVHGLFESLAKATTAEQVVRVLFQRVDGLAAAPASVSAPIQAVISEIRQEVSRAPTAAATDNATLPTRPSRLDAPAAEPLRTGGSRPSSSTRVSRSASRPVASRTRSVGAVSEDRIMKLVKKLQGLIHLAEAEHRLAEAQRQVRMAEDSQEARSEGGQGTRGAGQAGGSQDGSRMDIEQLGREVLDVVSRELEFRRERRMEDSDESIWW